MRSRDPALDANWGTTCTPLTLRAPDGKIRETDCANTEGLFRIIQSIPSPKAAPFKRWLAQVGYARVKEIENPELASARARELYKAKCSHVVANLTATIANLVVQTAVG
jgi:DNA-damage-inducible protein D